MVTLRITAEVPNDRRLVLTLPADVPTGPAELTVTVDSRTPRTRRPRTSLAAWAAENAEDWGDRLSSEDVSMFTGRRF